MNKLIFLLKRPKIVMVAGGAKETAKEAISQVLKPHFKVGKEILIIDQDFKFFIKHSRLPVLVVNGDIAQISEITKLAEILPNYSYLVLNFDDEAIRDLKNKSRAHPLTFGFGTRADIRATDIGTNFKINYQGNIVPVWLEKLFGKEQIYAALAAVAVGDVFGLNLVEISEALKKSSSII